MTYKNYLQSLDLSKTTIRAYDDNLLCFLSWLDGEAIEAEAVSSPDLMAWLNNLKQQEKSKQHRSHSLLSIRHFFDWQLQLGKRNDNPAKLIKLRGVKSRKLYSILSRDELENIYHKYDAAQAPTGKVHTHAIQRLAQQRNKTMLGLVLYQGLFTSEINELKVTDLNLKEGKVYVAGGRTSNERSLDLKSHQIMELMEYLLQTRKALLSYGTGEREELYLPAPASGQQTTTSNNSINVWKRLSDEVRKQQPRFLNFLQVRTSVITHWLKQYNLRQVQYMAGHRYVSTTEGYLINQMEDLQQDIDQFHPIG